MAQYKICILTYKRLAELVDGAIARLRDPELSIMTAHCHHASIYECVNASLVDGAEVFIAGGSNFEIFRESFDLPIIELSLSHADYFRSIREASEFGKKIAVVTYQTAPAYDFGGLADLLGVNITKITYDDSNQLQELIERSGCDAVVGAAFACEIAASAGKGSVLAYAGTDEILSKIAEAKLLAHEIRREKTRNRFFTIIIDNSPNAIVGVNQKGLVVNYNPAAERMLGVSALQARGQQCAKLFPELGMNRILNRDPDEPADQIIMFEGKELHLARYYVADSGDGASAIALLSEPSRHYKAEQDYLSERYERLKSQGFMAKNHFENIVSKSEKIFSLIGRAKVYAESNYSILIYGETGTGKELFAQSIHNHSDRAKASFVAINCAAIPDNLLESELFGYADGAFTGSIKGGKKGLFELANKGTIFLDEIGDLSPNMQQKLLRVLQEREIMRVGGDRVIPVDVRVLAATNKSPDQMLLDGFRSDLFYRLNVLSLELPPLRDRGDDVIHIFSWFLHRYTDQYKLPANIPLGSLAVLSYYSWPGNIRELENVCKRFGLLLSQRSGKLSQGAAKQLLCDCIGQQNLLRNIYERHRFTPGSSNDIDPEMVCAIKSCFGYANEYIADLLGVSRTTLWRIMKD